MDEPDQHPPGHQRGLDGNHRLEQCETRVFGLRGAWMVPGDRVVGEAAQQVDVAGDRGVLEAADPQVAACDAGEHRPGQRRLPQHLPARRHHRQGSGGRDAQRVHRLADDVLAQHRTDRGQAVATSCERRTTRTLQVDVAGEAIAVDLLAEQQRAPVAQTRHEPAELMSGIGLRYRDGAIRNEIAGQEAHTVGTVQPRGVEAQVGGQRLVQHEQPWVGNRFGLPADGHLRQFTREAAIQRDGGVRCDAHPSHPTEASARRCCRRGLYREAPANANCGQCRPVALGKKSSDEEQPS